MISRDKSLKMAEEWIDAWNSHDLELIMSHYSWEIEFTSPFVIKLMGDKTGTITGKEHLREYFQKGLGAYPDLKFELLNVLSGVDSITLYYKSVNELVAAEVMTINSEGKILKVIAHYSYN